MSISCDPNALLEGAKCIQSCTSPGMREAIKVWLLTQIAGVSADPNYLLEQSRCLQSCVPAQSLKAIESWLLCQIVNGGGSGGGQDYGIEWEPTNIELGARIGLFVYNDAGELDGVTSITINHTTNESGYDFEFANDLVSFSFPHLASTTGAGFIAINFCPLLTSLSFPVLVSVSDLFDLRGLGLVSFTAPLLATVGSHLRVFQMDDLASISFPALISSGGEFNFSTNPLLSSVSMPSLVPNNGQTLNFSGDALTAASVNHILARCVANAGFVSGTVNLSGGTSAAPTGQGIADATDLDGRGVTVTTN